MNRLKRVLSAFAIVAILVAPVATFTGCTLGQQQQAVLVEYRTLSGVINTVDVARGVYDELYKAGKVSQELDDKVAVIYKEYQRVGNLAITIAKAHTTGVNSGNPSDINIYVPMLQTLVNQLLDLFGQAPGMPKQTPITIAPGPGI